jgi:hypothetical protein
MIADRDREQPIINKDVHGAVLKGWRIVDRGRADYGDRYWSSGFRAWLPVVNGNSYLSAEVGNELVPTVIRKGGR